MSFGKLLATGKSLMGMKDTVSPYRMTEAGRLPRFGNGKNPFAVPAPEPDAPPSSPAASAAVIRPAVAAVPVGQATRVGDASVVLAAGPELPAVAKAPEAPVPTPPAREKRETASIASVRAVAAGMVAGHPVGPAPRRGEGAAVHSCSPLAVFALPVAAPRRRSWWSRLSPLRWFGSWGARRRPTGPAVQTEFAVTEIRVMRNDLLEADLLVVPQRPADGGAAAAPAAPAPVPGAMVVKPARTPNRRRGAGPSGAA